MFEGAGVVDAKDDVVLKHTKMSRVASRRDASRDKKSMTTSSRQERDRSGTVQHGSLPRAHEDMSGGLVDVHVALCILLQQDSHATRQPSVEATTASVTRAPGDAT